MFFFKTENGFLCDRKKDKTKEAATSFSQLDFFAFTTSHKCSDLAEVRKCIVMQKLRVQDSLTDNKETDKLIQSASLQSHKKLYAIQTTYKASDIIGKILKNFNKQFHGNMKEMAYETS